MLLFERLKGVGINNGLQGCVFTSHQSNTGMKGTKELPLFQSMFVKQRVFPRYCNVFVCSHLTRFHIQLGQSLYFLGRI